MSADSTHKRLEVGRLSVDDEEVRSRLTRPILDALDQWAGMRGDPIPSRSEAVRRALVAHLTALGYFR